MTSAASPDQVRRARELFDSVRDRLVTAFEQLEDEAPEHL